jgi:hypothetical protein
MRNVSSTTRRSRTRDATAALHAARANAAVRSAIRGNAVDDIDARTLDAFRSALQQAVEAARFARTKTKPSATSRQLASVGLALSAVAQSTSGELTDTEAMAASLEAIEADVNRLLSSEQPENESRLLGFLDALVALSGRRAASPGDTVVRSRS